MTEPSSTEELPEEVRRAYEIGFEAGVASVINLIARATDEMKAEMVSETFGLRNIDPDAYDNYEIREGE